MIVEGRTMPSRPLDTDRLLAAMKEMLDIEEGYGENEWGVTNAAPALYNSQPHLQ